MKLNTKRKKEIEKKVNSYIKSMEKKDDEGVVIDNPALRVLPEVLQKFFYSGILAGLTKKEALYAKCYFKDKLPFKEYKRSRGKDKDLRIADILHFRELQEGGPI